MKAGDILTLKVDIENIHRPYNTKSAGNKVTIKEVVKREAYYNWLYDIDRPEIIYGIKLEGFYGQWHLHCFEETDKG